MLGSDCVNVFNKDYEVVTPTKKDMDITNWDMVIENFQDISPDVVLNCAGFTDVDASEKEAAAVRKINVEGPRNLAQGCARFECKLIHISSDYVFDGKKIVPQPYFEDDAPNPLSVYGTSKMDSEKAIRENSPNFIIIRTGWLYGVYGWNFIKAILSQVFQKKQKNLKIADDQFGSPTYTYRLALQIRNLLDNNRRGTYHATAEGFCSRFEFTKSILKKLSIKIPIEPCSMKDYQGLAQRPVNCLLENRLLKSQGLNIMPNWKKDLDFFLNKFGERLIKEAKEAVRE